MGQPRSFSNSLGLTTWEACRRYRTFTSPRSTLMPSTTRAERLHKILSRAGVASRRTAETLILAGRIQVNGETVTRLGTTADPQRDRILVDGRPLVFPSAPLYFLLHKPVGVVSTLKD